MDQARLVGRLRSEVAAARAAITENYARLWRHEAETLPAGDDAASTSQPGDDVVDGSKRGRRSSHDLG